MTSIFERGKVKPGIYKIQNLQTEGYLDIHLHSMEMCCRPANDLGVGRGLVRGYSPSAIRASDDRKVGDQKIWGWIRGVAGEPVDIPTHCVVSNVE